MHSFSDQDEVRRTMRRHARHLLRDSSSTDVHLARVNAAMGLPGEEPVQGVLADIFTTFGSEQTAFKTYVQALAKDRLSEHMASWLESQIQAPRLPRISPLATRWSVLSIPSADISTRARRCSADDSRALAAHAVIAVEQADTQGEQMFLHHCLTCHDNLAFMLARRQLLKTNPHLPPGWDEVSQQLEKTAEMP